MERVEAKKQQGQAQRNVPISATAKKVGENQRSPLKETTNSHKVTQIEGVSRPFFLQKISEKMVSTSQRYQEKKV